MERGVCTQDRFLTTSATSRKESILQQNVTPDGQDLDMLCYGESSVRYYDPEQKQSDFTQRNFAQSCPQET
jgi:hypothetical protein